jgi:hypothetical protein
MGTMTNLLLLFDARERPATKGVKHTVNAAMPCPESGKTGNNQIH